MRPLKLMLITLALGGVSVLSLSCVSESDSSPSENQLVTVERGNLTIDITAAGNLALSRTEDLAFEIAGIVEEVLVEASDSVKEGQVLAKLDTSEWEDNLAILEDKLTTAERQLTTKERALTSAKRQVTAKERDLLQAKINLQTAEYNLDVMAKVQKIKDAIEYEEWKVKFANERLKAAFNLASEEGERMYWRDVIANAKDRITELQIDLAELLADPDNSGVTITKEALKKLAVDLAREKLEAAQIDVEDARIAIADAQIAVDDARKDVKDAQEALDEALEDSPEIVAPFDGFITKVNVDGGDEVLKGTVAVILADPAKFEAEVMVNEMDIFQVKLGGEARVQVDAMPIISLPAKVTHIAPTATIQSGVVNYKVKVEVHSLESAMRGRQEARQKAMPDISPGQIPERLRQAIEEGRITQEQAEEIMRRRQEGGGLPGGPPGGLPGGPPRGQQGQIPTMIPEDFQLKEGLTVTVSIIVEERNDVLIVPNKAIIRQGTESVVQVLKDGVVEERSIRTGISDYQNTEVIEGLSEGEKVVIPQKTTSAPTTSQQRRSPFLPGRPPGRPR